MKKQILFLLVALLSVGVYSCSDDDDSIDPNSIPLETRNAFAAKYPAASKIKWELKGTYQVADFYANNIESEAWFDANGMWYMTEHDIPYSALPQAVQTSFKASEYGTWKVDDVDMLERTGMETIYIIEVEQSNQDVDLYYSAEGILIKAVVDTDGGGYIPPQTTPSAIETFIQEKYPQARIVEIESEKGMLEVDIIHNNISKDVYFDLQNKWLYTSWDIRTNALPAAVTSAIAANASFAGYHIDDVEYIETPQGDHYQIELEKGNSEINIKIDAQGNILK